MNHNQPAPIKTLRILFIAAEADPLIKVGGLGDVGGSLPRALRCLLSEDAEGTQLDVRLAIPFHAGIDTQSFPVSQVASFTVGHTQSPIPANAFQTLIDGLPVYLIEGPPIPADGPVYSPDPDVDGRKFTFFSLGAMELARVLQWQPHILHANDWHTGMAVHYLKILRNADPFYTRTRSLFSLHNLPFMGAGTDEAVRSFGIPPSTDSRLPKWAKCLPLPMALSAADRIVAVSPGYAQDILTQPYGCGLDTYLKGRTQVLSGVLNGLDTETWNPATDRLISQPYDLTSLDRRPENKHALLERFSFRAKPIQGQTGSGIPDVPLLTLIGRMDPQKGVDLAVEGLRQAAHLPWHLIILGTGDAKLESAARKLESDFPDRVRAITRFDNALSHQLYAGADLLLMPSRYEPCGLAQMIAMRYGCVPLARRTGGLGDTIKPFSRSAGGTGFLFEEASPEAFMTCLETALMVYKEKAQWLTLQENGMAQDFSWRQSAIAYAKHYISLVEGSR